MLRGTILWWVVPTRNRIFLWFKLSCMSTHLFLGIWSQGNEWRADRKVYMKDWRNLAVLSLSYSSRVCCKGDRHIQKSRGRYRHMQRNRSSKGMGMSMNQSWRSTVFQFRNILWTLCLCRLKAIILIESVHQYSFWVMRMAERNF